MNMESPLGVSRQDAADALRIASEAGKRSEVLRAYQSASPHLILWGIAYAIAYTIGFFRPELAGKVWIVVVPLASAGDILVARRDRTDGDWSIFAILFATFIAFVLGTSAIMQPQDPRQMAAFVPLIVAASYVVLGIGGGWRLMATGVALFVLTLLGFFAFPHIFLLWMAVVGGGALVLGGLWMRRV